MSENFGKKFQFKIIVLGDPGVGKTSLIKNYIEKTFTHDYKPTIGTNIFLKTLEIDDTLVKISLWDIGGQERWQTMRRAYYKGAQGAIIVGDMTRKLTFKNIKGFWAPDLYKNLSKDFLVLILANKDDIKAEIEVDDDTIQKIARDIEAISVIKTSAKTGFHVNEAFKLLITNILEHFMKIINEKT